MEILFIINIVGYVFLECYYPIFLSKKLKLGIISPITIFAYSSIPILLFKVFVGPLFVIENGLLNKYFNYAIFMTNISLLSKYFITSLTIHTISHLRTVKKWVNTLMPHWNVKTRKIRLAAFIILCLAILCFILLSSHSYGVIAWLTNPRDGYQFHRTGAGHFYVLSILFFSISFTLYCIYAKNDKDVLKWIIIYVIFVYFLGSKNVILSFGISGVIFLWFRKYPNLYKMFFLIVPLIFLILLKNFGSFEYADIAAYFDYYVNSAMYYEEYFNGGIDLFYGEISRTNIWGIIPRALFPNKPYVYGMLLVNEHFFPGAAEASHTPEFGGPVMAFADWGVIGVIVSSLLDFTLIFKLILYKYLFADYKLTTIQNSPSKLYSLMILFSPSFMFLVGFPLTVVLWIIVVKIISITNRIIVRPIKTQ